MSSETEAAPSTEKALQIPQAQVVRRMSWIGVILDFFFGWMWRKKPAPQAIERQAEPKALPAALPAKTLAQLGTISEGKRLLAIVQSHPAAGCIHPDDDCRAGQKLRAFMGFNGLVLEDLEISAPDFKSAISRVPVAHTKGYMERALRGEFGRYHNSDLRTRMREHQLTANVLGVTQQHLAAVERAEKIHTCAMLLDGLRGGSTSLSSLRDAMTRHSVTAQDLKTTEREFELY